MELNDKQNLVVNFSLERSVYEFSQVEVKGEIPTKWFDQLEIFKKLLLGTNIYAKKCVIKNPYIIDFKEENSKLTATAREPIIIQNNALGYKIECVLKNFSYDLNSRGLVTKSIRRLRNLKPMPRILQKNIYLTAKRCI